MPIEVRHNVAVLKRTAFAQLRKGQVHLCNGVSYRFRNDLRFFVCGAVGLSIDLTLRPVRFGQYVV